MHIPEGLQLYRIKAGYKSKAAAVEALNKSGLEITFSRYDNIEQGRTKRITPLEANVICKVFNMSDDFFLNTNT